jgi:nucleotide-binding universal stress UspA family protein
LAADNAIDFGIQIALKENARILLVNAYELEKIYTRMAFPIYFIDAEIRRIEEKANYHLEMKCDWIKNKFNLDCDCKSIYGAAKNSILELIKQKKPTLVVMGTNGASGIKDKLMGSTTSNIITKSKYPVLAVPLKAKFGYLRNIAYLTNLRHYNATVKKIHQFKFLSNPKIALIHVYEDPLTEPQENLLLGNIQKQLKNKFKKIEFSYHAIRGLDIGSELSQISKSKRYDLLVMNFHKRSLLESLIFPNMTKKIVNYTRVPLLVIPT